MKNLKLVGILVALSVVMFSCLNTDDADYVNPEDSAWLAFINASPGSQGLKYYDSGILINTPKLNYGTFHGYVNRNKGVSKITVRMESSLDLDTLEMNLVKNSFYSIFAVNTPDSLELVSYLDNHVAAESGKSLIRFIQLSPDSPSIKLMIEDEEGSLGTYAFKDASAFINVNHGVSKKFILINAETDEILLTKELNLGNGNSYSIFSKGLVNTTDESKALDIQVITLQ